MSQTSESKPAGMWRPIELTDGDIVKLFQSGKHGEANYRQFDGRWYVLDESTEAIAEARQEEKIKDLESYFRGARNGENAKYKIICEMSEQADRLTADLAKVTAQRDRLLKWVKGMHGYERSEKNCDVCDFITAIEQGRE